MLSDEKGYAFTPLTLLLFIPIVILAISYGNIVSEANMLANIATGGDVTFTVSKDVINNIKLASEQSGRNAAYLATSTVINNSLISEKPFFKEGESKNFIKKEIRKGINNHLRNISSLKKGTGRNIKIRGISVNNDTEDYITDDDLEIYQTEPFGFYINLKPGINVEVEQEGQIYMGVTPNITTYVSIEGLEDAYMWIRANERYSSVFYAYPYYSSKSDASGTVSKQYFFNNNFDISDSKLHYLWECLNGTGNPSGITPRPYYFPDTNGLSFFDRLENRSLSNRYDNVNARLSTFVLDDPQPEIDNEALTSGKLYKSAIDSEYFNKQRGYKVSFYNKTNHGELIKKDFLDPSSIILVLSKDSLDRFGLIEHVDYDTYGTPGKSNAEVRLYV